LPPISRKEALTVLHARSDYNRIQDPALTDPSLLSPGSTPIGADEPVFLIRAQDLCAGEAVRRYADLAEAMGAASDLVEAARAHADRIGAWQSVHPAKVPDVVARHLEFCKRCGAGPRGNDPNDPEDLNCADCGNPWPTPWVPRRNDISRAHPTETIVRAARQAVEAMPPDVRLTRASTALGEALSHVADYVDGVPPAAEDVSALFARPSSSTPERYGLRLRRVPSPAGGRLHVTRTAFNVHVFLGSWWLSVPFPRHRLA
jgi:hypothetical protein